MQVFPYIETIFPYIETIVFSPLSYEIISLGSVPFSCYDSLNEGPLPRPLRVNGINRRRVTEIFDQFTEQHVSGESPYQYIA